jgi:hypothetical protein
MSALRMHRHSLPHRLPLWLPHWSLRPDRLYSGPDLRPGRTVLGRTMLGRTIASPMVIWLLGVRRKGKRQRNQWKDDPRSVGSVHSCTPLSDVAVIGNRLGLFSVVVSRQLTARAILLIALSPFVLLQIVKIATILRSGEE